MAFRMRDAIVTPNPARDGDLLSIHFDARSFNGLDTITAGYAIAGERSAALVGENPKQFQIFDEATPCPNVLRLHVGDAQPGIHFVTIVARNGSGEGDSTFARITILP